MPHARTLGPLLALLLAGSAAAQSPAPVASARRGPPAPPAAKLTAAEIDAALAACFPREKLTPSPPADDVTFLRRAWLDLVGTIPTLAALESFRSDTALDRRTALVDRLLGTRRFAEHWADVLSRVILGRTAKLEGPQRIAFDHWLAERLAVSGVGLDRIAREVVAAEGTPMDNPAVALVMSFEDSKEDMAGHMARVFLGSQIQCAQCHDHPFEPWKRTEFYGVAAFFARARRTQIPRDAYEALRSGEIGNVRELSGYLPKPLPDDPKNGEVRRAQAQIDRLQALWARQRVDVLAYRGANTLEDAAEQMGMTGPMSAAKKDGKLPAQLPLLIEAPDGEIEIPRADGAEPATGPGADPKQKKKKEHVPPRFLTGESPVYPDGGVHRRAKLAAWMTAPENPYFARAMANRVWTALMGHGLVEPVDNVANPTDSSHRQLLDRLAGHLIASGYDLRQLVRLIAATEAYQRSVVPNATNAKDVLHFSRGAVRPLEPEQIFSAILEATGLERSFQDGRGAEFVEMKQRFEREFVFKLQVDEASDVNTYQGTISQALFTLNSSPFTRSVRAMPGSALHDLRRIPDTEDRLKLVVRRTLSREATPDEIQRLLKYVKSHSEDPTWGIPPAPPPAPAKPGFWARWFGKAAPAPSPSPKPLKPAPQLALRRSEAMWRSYEDILWSLIASTEFAMNH